MYQQLLSWDNLLLAYRRASKGKRGAPVVAAFEYRLEDNLIQLQQQLAEQSYRPGSYVTFTIHEPKRRVISAAPFRDRVVHHALCNLIEPIFERSFIAHSYANRVGKGTHRALERCQQLARAYPYVLACDIRQFFPSLDHAVLREALWRKVTDPQVRWLIDQILASGQEILRDEYSMVYFPGDDLFAITRPRGLPIGNLTSQFWANVYLNSFDHFVLRQLHCSAYGRYVDDILLFAPDKATLWSWREQIIQRLASLRLTIHPTAYPQPTRQGIPFLGFLVYPDHRRLKRRKGVHWQRKFRQMVDAYALGDLSLAQLSAAVQGWVNHVRFGNTIGLRKAILTRRTVPHPIRNTRRGDKARGRQGE